MKKGYLAVGAVMMLAALLMFQATADAGTVAINNKFASAVRVGIYAGASESQVTVYPGESRTYTTFISKSIDKINVMNTAGGANPLLGSYTVPAPSASTDYTVGVDSNGAVAVTVAVIP